jgi:hypothetical protein
MKTILITVFFRILFLDSQTEETLTGVKVQTNQGIYYSNLDGEVFIPTEEEVLSVSYVSYKTKNDITLSNDTIMSLSQINFYK